MTRTDYPRFGFVTNAGMETWWLYRQMKTEQYAFGVKDASTLDAGEFEWLSKDDADVERRDDPASPELDPVRDAFLDAVALAFTRGPGPSDDWNLTPIREATMWYEAEAIEGLVALRQDASSARLPADVRDDDATPREMPSATWDLITAARSHFTLADSAAYKPGEGNGPTGDPDRRPSTECALDDWGDA